MSKPEWTKHLEDDEVAWLGAQPAVDIILMRLARIRSLYHNLTEVVDGMNEELEQLRPPPSPEEEAAFLLHMSDPEIDRDLRAMDRCVENGGHVWEEYHSVIFAGFPALRCTSCECSTLDQPPVPPPPIKEG